MPQEPSIKISGENFIRHSFWLWKVSEPSSGSRHEVQFRLQLEFGCPKMRLLTGPFDATTDLTGTNESPLPNWIQLYNVNSPSFCPPKSLAGPGERPSMERVVNVASCASDEKSVLRTSQPASVGPGVAELGYGHRFYFTYYEIEIVNEGEGAPPTLNGEVLEWFDENNIPQKTTLTPRQNRFMHRLLGCHPQMYKRSDFEKYFDGGKKPSEIFKGKNIHIRNLFVDTSNGKAGYRLKDHLAPSSSDSDESG